MEISLDLWKLFINLYSPGKNSIYEQDLFLDLEQSYSFTDLHMRTGQRLTNDGRMSNALIFKLAWNM